ncbi:metallophosphoesterase family protein [[Eubacterium] cellulosolvens]
MFGLGDLLEEVDQIQAGTLLELTYSIIERLRDERRKGYCGKNHVKSGLVTFLRKGDLLVVGDLHGDYESLKGILTQSKIIPKLGLNSSVLFLGDYGDRGDCSPEVYFTVLRLKSEFPRSVFLLRGNHEGPQDLLAVPHDLPYQLQSRYGHQGKKAYQGLIELFDVLYHAAIIPGKYLFVHGGIPSEARSLDEIAFADVTHPQTSYLEEILWSDPQDDIQGVAPSPRGAGKFFGPDITELTLGILNVKTLIRGHEAFVEGYSTHHEGKILTLFSCSSPPYNIPHAIYLLFQINNTSFNAHDLAKWVRAIE